MTQTLTLSTLKLRLSTNAIWPSWSCRKHFSDTIWPSWSFFFRQFLTAVSKTTQSLQISQIRLELRWLHLPIFGFPCCFLVNHRIIIFMARFFHFLKKIIFKRTKYTNRSVFDIWLGPNKGTWSQCCYSLNAVSPNPTTFSSLISFDSRQRGKLSHIIRNLWRTKDPYQTRNTTNNHGRPNIKDPQTSLRFSIKRLTHHKLSGTPFLKLKQNNKASPDSM